ARREIPLTELRRFLAEHLPPEAIPSSLVSMDSLPLGEGGKLDRSALPVSTTDRPLLDVAFVPPRDPAEEELVEIWRDVLGLDDIGVHDNFFEIGGDSMHCIQIVALAHDKGLLIEPRDLFNHPTVAALAAAALPAEDARIPEAAGVTDEEFEDLQHQFGEF
ncbi:MAG: phosphopantetheine-binding protein, partial [Gemmatimonadota bacterium]|nr:phosphopantetheine-binding protein [Gemmatimonadota bacterium]